MRWSRGLAPLFMVILVAACGGSPAASADGNGGNGGSSQAADTPEPAASTDGGNGGNGGDGGSEGDLDQLADDLTPPNSSETSRTTAGGLIFLTFESSDSPDDLRSFYESAIANTGMEVFSTTSAEGSYSWIFAESEGSAYGGVVTVTPGTDGSGSFVGVQVGSGE